MYRYSTEPSLITVHGYEKISSTLKLWGYLQGLHPDICLVPGPVRKELAGPALRMSAWKMMLMLLDRTGFQDVLSAIKGDLQK